MPRKGAAYVVLLVGVLLPLYNNALLAQEQWVTFFALKGGFSVLAPGNPNESELPHPTGLTVQFYTWQSGIAGFGVNHVDIPPSTLQEKGPARFLEGWRDGRLEFTGGKLLRDGIISIDGHPGREFAIEAAGVLSTRVRVYMVKTRLYEVSVSGPTEELSSNDASRFLESFKLSDQTATTLPDAQETQEASEAQQQWATFSSLKGGFSVSAPGKPSERKLARPSHVGTIHQFVYTWHSGYVQLIVAYADIPESDLQKKGPGKVFEEVRDGTLQIFGGNVLKESAISLDGNEGREFVMGTTGVLSTRVRLYIVKTRLYQVSASGPIEELSSRDGSRFLESFKLSDRTASSTEPVPDTQETKEVEHPSPIHTLSKASRNPAFGESKEPDVGFIPFPGLIRHGSILSIGLG